MLVPRFDSSILHCWTMEISDTSSFAREINTCLVMMSLLDESSLLKKPNFLIRILVETAG